jgi:DNA-binding transcriptional MerR regulator
MKYPEIDKYYADPSPENRDKLMDILGQEHFKISDLGVTSRVFSNWKLKNIIPKVDERQWVRLNLFEYFWIQIIKDFRALGLPLKLIEKVKDQLFNHLSFKEVFFDEQDVFQEEILRDNKRFITDEEFEQIKSDMINNRDDENVSSFLNASVPLFFFIVANVLLDHADIKLTINQDGEVGFITKELDMGNYINEAIKTGPLVILSLKRYVYMLMSEPTQVSTAQQLGLLNEVESEVIKAMRENNLKELVINFDPKGNHKDLTYTWEKSIKQEDMENVLNQFLGKKHVSLSMKSNDGKTVQYEYQNRKRIKN